MKWTHNNLANDLTTNSDRIKRLRETLALVSPKGGCDE